MNFACESRRHRREAQTLVFFLIAWGTIMLLAGLAIDSGLLFLAKARMSRAVDGAALAAVGNFNRDPDPATNRDDVAVIMRNFAAANFTDLSSISATASPHGGSASAYTLPNGTAGTTYVYSFNDGTQDANGQYRRFVQVTLNTGSGGAITSATCNARCPVQTYFIGYATYAINGKRNVKIGGYSGPTGLVDLKVSSSAIATRNPRLIMVVVDRSASMLEQGGGASGLPPAIVQFLDFFDTSSDYIGIVSFGSSARLEMPMTTNFIIAGTNNLIDAYNTNDAGDAIPGLDPEDTTPDFATNGVRRLKFGGQTAADEGIRLGLEQLMANSGFNDPDVVKYMVVFTDGKWNASRTLLAAPAYTNTMVAPTNDAHHVYPVLTNPASASLANGATNANVGFPGPWNNNNISANSNLIVMPSMGTNKTQNITANLTNALAFPNTNNGVADFTAMAALLAVQTNQSIDSSGYEPMASPTSTPMLGNTMAVTNMPYLSSAGTVTNYTHNVDLWMQPGSVAYYYTNNTLAPLLSTKFVSDYTDPDRHINVVMATDSRIDLVMPGYIADGIFFDGLDMGYAYPEDSDWPRYRCNFFQESSMWPDDSSSSFDLPYISNSLERQLMFRNYPNLLTGFYIFRPDEPLSTAIEPLDDTIPDTLRPLYGLGPYYPSAGFYWSFDLVGVDYGPTFALRDPNSDPDPNGSTGYAGGSRHVAYSINMLSTNAAPEWSGELFYKSISGSGTNTYSGLGTTSASQIMTSSDWKSNAPSWVLAWDVNTLMTNEAAHNTNISPNPSVWRPLTFNGSNNAVALSSVTASDGINYTDGYVSDGNGHYYRNAMGYSGRPTHYYDFSQSKWVAIQNNHFPQNIQALQLGNWKAREYCWHARALGVTIYTVGYGTHVSDDQQAFLAQLANSTNTTAGGGSNISFNPNQPIGSQFYATNAVQISNDFYQVGQAINAALTQ